MKKLWKYMMITAAAVALTPLTACDDDDVDPYDINYVYVYQPNSTFASVEYKANGDFMSGLTDPLKVMPIRTTKPAPGNMSAQITIDPTLVAEYNEANGTDYKFLEGAEIINPTMTIAAGEYISTDSITVGFTDHSGFMNQESDLILPIVIRSAHGATVSKSSRIFLTFNSTYRPNKLSASPSVTFAAVTEESGWENTIKKLVATNSIRLSYNPFEEVTVNLKIDQSKVAEYNSANGTSFLFKSDATLEANTLTIGTDVNAGTFTINTGDLSGIAAGNSYIVPVTVTSATGAAVEYIDNSTTVYVLIRAVGMEITMVNSSSSISGTSITLPNNMTVTVDGDPNYRTMKWIDIVNPDTWSYGYMTTSQEMLIDFGETINLTAFYVNHYYSSASASSVTLQTSTDGSTWNDWGKAEWTNQSSSYWIKLSFESPTRYMKLVYPTAFSSSIEIDGMRFYTK